MTSKGQGKSDSHPKRRLRPILTAASLLCLALHFNSHAQIPIGSWREHLPYRHGNAVTATSSKVYCATPYSLMVFDPAENSVDKLSKMNGLSEVGITAIGADEQTGYTLVAYQNSNLDLLTGNKIHNISDIKTKTINADKSINNIYWNQQLAYLCSGIGVIVVDPARREVKDTYIIGAGGNYAKVSGVATDAQFIYAASEEGLKKAPKTTVNLSDYRQWSLESGSRGLPAGNCMNVVSIGGKILAQVADTLWVNDGSNWKLFYSDGFSIDRLHVAGERLHLIESTGPTSTRLLILKADGTLAQSNSINTAKDAITLNNVVYVADSAKGLISLAGSSVNVITPNGPATISDGQMIFAKSTLWVASGGVTNIWEKQNKLAGIFSFSNGEWANLDSSALPGFGKITDIVSMAVDPNSKELFAGSFGDGVVSISSNNSVKTLKENSIIRPAENDPTFYAAAGLAFDKNNNLWIANYGALHSLVVKKPDGSSNNFGVPGSTFDFAFSRIIIDDEDQKWIISPKNNGLFCFNSGSSIDNPGDDRWKHYGVGAGNGNLPDNNVLSVAKDKSGFIWVGTAKGVGIIQCTKDIFTASGCEAILPIVQQDNFAGYLFSNEQVQTIAVDAGDRKWIGTKNGVWLVSRYGEKTIQHFTETNSPLLSNDVKEIAIDAGTGEVFFETAKGICSFRGDATETLETQNSVLVFPNPVPPNYNGLIAIKGLSENAFIKITEMDGRLVYQTRAIGSTATWNGYDYLGRKISPGVYLVLARDENGKDQLATKIVFVK